MINFPDSPTLNQQFIVGGKTWQWTGTAWDTAGINFPYIVPGSLQASLNQIAQATTNKYYLRGDGTNVTMSAIQDGDLPVTQDAKTLTNIASESTLKDSAGTAFQIGYRQMPQNNQAGATTYQFVLADDAKHVFLSTGSTSTITVPANATTQFAIGTVITVVNNNSGICTINGPTNSLQLAAGTLASTRYIATKGMATLIKVAADLWYVAGAGVT